MRNLFYKEIRLTVPKLLYLFAGLSLLTLVPSYPLITGLGYCFMAVFVYIQSAREKRDLEFLSVLPIKRENIVAVKTLVVIFLEMLFIAVAVPCAIAANLVISPLGNIVGLDPNLTFFGVAFAGYGVFNLVFFPWHFKSGYKYGGAMITGIVCFLLFYGICETVIQIFPALRQSLDTLEKQYLIFRLYALIAGILFFAVSTLSAYKMAVKNFNKANL